MDPESFVGHLADSEYWCSFGLVAWRIAITRCVWSTKLTYVRRAELLLGWVTASRQVNYLGM